MKMTKKISRGIKVILDFTGAVFALILLSPVMIWAACKIRKEDKGPVFFIQKRIGKDLKPFMTYNFRTMFMDAEARAQILFSDERIKEE